MKKFVFSCLSLLLLSVTDDVYCQSFLKNDFVFRHLTVEDGLSQGNVNCITQDKKGYLWIGTQDGLNRYDGYNFKYFRHDHEDSTSISSSYILCMTEGLRNTFLVGTDNGLNIFNASDNKFKSFKHIENNNKSLPGNEVNNICRINDSIYCGSAWGEGFFLFNINTYEFNSFQNIANDIASLCNNSINTIKIGSDKKIYIGTRSGFSIFDLNNKRFTNFKRETDCINCFDNDNIQSIYEDGNKLWLGTFDGSLIYFNKNNKKFNTHLIKPKTIIYDMIRISDSTLLVGSIGSGLFIFNENNNTVQNIVNDLFNSNSINNNIIYNFFVSSDKILWIGTAGGLNYYHKNFGFINVDQKFIKNTLNYQHNVYSVYHDREGIIWSGSLDNGLRSYNSNNGEVKYYQSNPKLKNSISSNSIISLCEDDEGNMWIGTFNKGISRLNKKTDQIISYFPDTGKANSTNIVTAFCITQSKDKKLWIGTQVGGIYIFDKASQKFSFLQKNSAGNSSVNSNAIYSIKEAKNGDMLICTVGGGLNILNSKTGKFEYFTNDPKNKNSISSDEVYCVHEDSHGILWLGTSSGGLNVYDRKKNIFHCFTEKDGLPNNDIYGILADNNGALWMSTIKGICKFSYLEDIDLKKLSDASYRTKNILIQNFNHSDGLISDEFNQGAFFKTKDDKMYFGSVKGMISFNPLEISGNSFYPPTAISRIKNYRNEIFFTDSSIIELDYKNYLTVEFVSLSYLASEKNKYAFMFAGRDTAWNDLGTNKNVSFLDLKPGEYLLKIKSSNNDGIWGTKPATLKIKVNPPFYETWWFRISVIIFIVVAVYLYVTIRIRQIKKEESQKTAFNKSLSEVEMKALRSQMNPHFIFNSLQSIKKFIMENEKNIASEYLSKFAVLMRLILENSRKQEVTLDKDLSALELYMQLEKLRFQNRFNFSINVDKAIDRDDTLIAPLLLQPFVENSILHGVSSKENGMIKITVAKENDMLYCAIEDNGKGRNHEVKTEEGKEQKRESLGMKITQERLNIINQQKKVNANVNIVDLMDENNNPAGVRVELLLPFETAF